MNIFSFILLGIVFFIFLKFKDIKKQYLAIISLLISFDMFINIGYFVKIGGNEVIYSELLLIIALMYSIIFITKISIDRKSLFIGLLFIASIVITESLLVINPLNEVIVRNKELVLVEMSLYSLMVSLRTSAVVFVVLNWRSLFNEDDLDYISNFIHKFGRLMLLICLFELFTKNILDSNIFLNLSGKIFGIGDSTVTFLFKRAGIYTLQGLTREPSTLARGLFYFTSILIFSKKFKEIRWDILVIVLILFLSGSFSAVLFISAILVFSYFKANINKKIFLLISSFILFFIFINSEVGSYYIMRVGRSFRFFADPGNIHELMSTSEAFRFSTILEVFSLMMKRPLFGIGLGIPYSYGYIGTALASVGLVGFSLWYYYIFHSVSRQNTKTIKYILILILVWMFSDSMRVMYSTITFYLALLIDRNTNAEI